MLVACFLFIKVMAGKLFFKPYKVTRFFEKEVHELAEPIVFKENSLSMGYTLIALMTDYLFDVYKVEFERQEGKALNSGKDIGRVKQQIF